MRLANFFKYKFILLYSVLVFLLWFFIIGGIILLMARPEKPIVMQYLDYQCNPISGEVFIIEDYKSNFLAGNSVYSAKVVTDENGYATLTRKYDSLFKIINKNTWEDPWYGSRNHSYVRDLTNGFLYSGSEIREAITSTPENPLIIYPYHTSPFNGSRGFTKSEVEFPKNRFEKNNLIEHVLISRGTANQTIGKLIISRDENIFSINIYGQRNGGLIEVSLDDLPFDETIPTQGYLRHYEFDFPVTTIFPTQTQRAFYFKSTNGKGYGMLVLSFTIVHESLVMNSFIDSFLFKKSPGAGSIELPVFLPQESCGGVAARHYDGYYGTISKSSRLIKSIQKKYSYESKNTSNYEIESADRKSLETKARDINTEDSWFVEIGPNPRIAFLAINNNAPIQSRLEILFNINHDGRSKPPAELTHRIARDIRTPSHILREIYDLNITDRINWEVMLNPNTPADVADNLFNKLTSKILEIPEYERELMNFYNRVFSPYHGNSISREALNQSVVRIADRLAQSTPWNFYLDKRVSPQSISAIWEAQKEHNKGKEYRLFLKYPLVTNENTPLPVLMDIYQYLVNNMGTVNNQALIKLLDNPVIPHEIFYDLKNNTTYGSRNRFYVLACSERTPSEILSDLAGDSYSDQVRRCVARNPGVSRDTLLTMPKKYLRSVVKNPSLRKSDFLDLFDDFESRDLIKRYPYSLMESSLTPAHVIQMIYENNWIPSDSLYFIDNISTPIEVLTSMYGKDNRLDEKIAGHPNLSERLALNMLDDARIIGITLALARNPATPDSILWRLFNDDFVVTNGIVESGTLNIALYCNSSTPKEIKYQLPYMASRRCKVR